MKKKPNKAYMKPNKAYMKPNKAYIANDPEAQREFRDMFLLYVQKRLKDEGICTARVRDCLELRRMPISGWVSIALDRAYPHGHDAGYVDVLKGDLTYLRRVSKFGQRLRENVQLFRIPIDLINPEFDAEPVVVLIVRALKLFKRIPERLKRLIRESHVVSIEDNT
jgi:hypothetical protein